MKLRQGPAEGSYARAGVLAELARFGVEVNLLTSNLFELVDCEGDPEVLILQDPLPPEMIVHLYRRFGALHGFLITDLIRPN